MYATGPRPGIGEAGTEGAEERQPDSWPSRPEESSTASDSSELEPTVALVVQAENTLAPGALGEVDRDEARALELARALVLRGRYPDPMVVRSFGDYEVIEKIASGGMGVVYLARQKSLRRTVALKMILAGALASDEDLRRFHEEAQAAAELDHKGIVPIFEIGEHEGQAFFSMSYVEGGSLADQLKDGPLGCRRAAELVVEVAEAVGYAHQQGIIHRDLKPSNILLDREGHAKVTDFGLAKRDSALSHLTHTGEVVGTPSFMAPEQATGESHEVGAPADLYAMGALLFCLITGRPPFQAATPIETLRQVLDQEPVSPRQLNGSVSRDLETICLKCLQKDPARRYDDAAALAEDLGRYLAGEPILARPIGGLERVGRWCWRNPRVAGLAVSFVLSLVLGIVATSYFWLRARREAESSRRSAIRALDLQEESDGRWYASEIGRAYQDLSSSRFATVSGRLDSLRPRSGEDRDLRGFEWHYLERLRRAGRRVLRGHESPIRGIAFGRDGRLVASVGGLEVYGRPGEIRMWDAGTGSPIWVRSGHSSCVRCVAFSPDGGRLATASALHDRAGEVKIWDAATGDEITVLPDAGEPVWGLAFSPDGRRLAAAVGRYDGIGRPLSGSVVVWDLPGRRPSRSRDRHGTAARCVAWSPDGRFVLSADAEGFVKVWDAEDLGVRSTFVAHSAQVTGAVFSPDGARLATGSMDQSVRVWDVRSWPSRGTAPPQPQLTLHVPSLVHGVAFSPDGRSLAAGCEDRSVRVWDLATRKEVMSLGGHADEVLGVAFSPDGWRLASAGKDRTVRLWDASSDRTTMPLRDHRVDVDSIRAIAFSPDGRLFGSSGGDAAVRIRETDNDLVTQTLRGHTEIIHALAFSHDGRFLCSAGEDRAVRIWDVATGKPIRVLGCDISSITGLDCAPDGRWLACAGGEGKRSGSVMLWRLGRDGMPGERPERVYRVSDARFEKVAFSPDGRWLAAGCHDGSIRVWGTIGTGAGRTLRGHAAEVHALTFNPDSRSLASASSDGTVRVWDVASGEARASIEGHAGGVRSVIYSPDGRRLVTAASDMAVRFADSRTGQEVMRLPVTLTSVHLAFHPDGLRLAIGGSIGRGSDYSCAILDAREQTPELRDRDEARSRVAFLYERLKTADEVRERLRVDPCISEDVRGPALALVDPYEKDLARRDAEDLIFRLRRKGLLRDEILERLRTDPGLSGPVRREALALAGTLVESASSLNQESLAVVHRADAEPSAYERALRQSETACRLTPYRADYRTTLGIAQYRLKMDREALDTLSQSSRDHSAVGETDPAGLAFRAMVQFRLGRKDEAQANLGRLRDLLAQPARGGRDEADAFRREAERLIIGEGAGGARPGVK